MAVTLSVATPGVLYRNGDVVTYKVELDAMVDTTVILSRDISEHVNVAAPGARARLQQLVVEMVDEFRADAEALESVADITDTLNTALAGYLVTGNGG